MDLTPLPVYLANPLRPRTVVGRVGRVAVEAGAEQDAVRVVVLELGRHLLRGPGGRTPQGWPRIRNVAQHFD
jgi:hypothetical protein